jgi:hypothetical protein
MIGTLIFLFLLYIAVSVIIAKLTTHNVSDFVMILLMCFAFTPVMGLLLALILCHNGGYCSDSKKLSTEESAAIGFFAAEMFD